MLFHYQFDLNCDMGESFGAYTMAQDEAIMPHINSANIACGFHAGDFSVMHKTVALAYEHRVNIGAHPSFPDLQGFGRRAMQFMPSEIYDMVSYQIGALYAFVEHKNMHSGPKLHHVKPHGALYNLSAKDPAVAEAIAKAVKNFDSSLILVGLSGSVSIIEAKNQGLKVMQEVFADRNYMPDGSLVPRTHPQALVHDTDEVVARVIQMVHSSRVEAIDGQEMKILADTVCVHGDGPNALALVKALRHLQHGS